MNWCCMGFEGHCLAAGGRGFSVLVSTRDGPAPSFILQHRALDPGAEVPPSTSPLSFVSDVKIRFCPWCGVNLSKWYRRTFGELDRSDLQVGGF